MPEKKEPELTPEQQFKGMVLLALSGAGLRSVAKSCERSRFRLC